jgi:hypothetical protein
MNFVMSIFFNSISFTTCVKLLMTFTIISELIDNLLYSFLLSVPCTLGNLRALVLRLSKLVDGVIPTFACHPQTQEFVFQDY